MTEAELGRVLAAHFPYTTDTGIIGCACDGYTDLDGDSDGAPLRWASHVLAIEAEAVSEYREALLDLVDAVRSGNGWDWTEEEEKALHRARSLLDHSEQGKP